MEKLRFETQAIRTQAERSQHDEHSVPMYLTSSFVFEDAEEMRATFADEQQRNIYSRFSNPNVQEFVDKLCLLEGAEAGVATATGMAAVFGTFMAHLKQGDHILSSRAVFGSTHNVLMQTLPDYGITTTYGDVNDPESWEALVRPETKLLYVETPSNPGVEILDLAWLRDFCDRHNLLYVVDNCFATPYLQKPIDFGADLVVHSATKWIDGQGRVLGGAVVGKAELIKPIFTFVRRTGPSLSPFNAWVLSKSLETLHVRMDRHCSNALTLAQRLESHPDVEQVRYPFLNSHPQAEVARKQMTAGGGIVCFELDGGIERGRKYLDALQVCSLTANLGDSRTIATHPASTTHAKLTEAERLAAGIPPGLIRISVGLEHIEDIAGDIWQAIKASR
ncbi:MAG TPA: O-succinylhomoserine sulfhydrylase [Cytophagales bacterium]|nr:O-succinylhomoserine sulfhydrylase [Cytophagales bacterium]